MGTTQTGTAVVAAPQGDGLDPASHAELARAMADLSGGKGLIVHMADLVGGAMGRTVRFGTRSLGFLPNARATLDGIAEVAMKRAFDVAVLRLGRDGQADRSRRLASPLVALSGAVGGLVGLGGFLPDATVTTLAIMREIARIATEAGEDLHDPGTRAACLEVFALDSGANGSTEPDGNYFSARLVMQGRPLAILLADVARRFGVTLSEKLTLQAVPIVGALTGASLNAAFLAHYRKLAHAHFTVRRLERRFGEAAVKASAAA